MNLKERNEKRRASSTTNPLRKLRRGKVGGPNRRQSMFEMEHPLHFKHSKKVKTGIGGAAKRRRRKGGKKDGGPGLGGAGMYARGHRQSKKGYIRGF